jgi:hypothetical protein
MRVALVTGSWCWTSLFALTACWCDGSLSNGKTPFLGESAPDQIRTQMR